MLMEVSAALLLLAEWFPIMNPAADAQMATTVVRITVFIYRQECWSANCVVLQVAEVS
jgi:hypothetical protein